MRNLIIHTALSLISHVARYSAVVCVAIAVMSCEKKTIEPNTPTQREGSVKVNIETANGTITATETVNKPTFVITVSGGDEEANYSLDYSVDERPVKTISGIWSGKQIDLSGLFPFSEYGSHSIKGTIYNDSDKTDQCSFEEVVWVVYELTNVNDGILETAERTVSLSDNTELFIGETGSLVIAYEPKNSVLPIKLSVSGEGATFESSKATCANGKYTVPFIVNEVGRTNIVLTLENGPEKKESRYSISCSEDTQGVTLGLDVSPAPLSVNNEGLDVDIKVRTNQSKRFDVAYLVDDKPVDAVIETQISDVFSKTIPTTGLAEGQHKLSVTITESDNQKVSVTKDATFYHGNLALLFDDKAVSRTTENILEVGKAVSMKVVGIPTEALYLVTPSFNAKKDKVTTPKTSWGEDQQGAWTLLPFSFGRSPIYIHIEGGKGRKIEFPVTRLETVPVKLTKTQDHSHYYIQIGENPTGAKPYSESTELQYNISARFDYAGRCDYETAADEGAASDLHINYQATRYDYAAYEKTDKKATFGQSLELIDLSSEVSEYATKYYESEVWDKVKETQKKKQKYYYQLDVTELSLSVRVQNGTKDADCLKFSTDVNWNYLKFNQ